MKKLKEITAKAMAFLKRRECLTEVQTEQVMIEDAMVLISGDMFLKVYNLPNNQDWVEVTNTIKEWAREFVKQLDWQGKDDERDWLIELEHFEDKKFAELSKWYEHDYEYKEYIENENIKKVLSENGLMLGDRHAAEVLKGLAAEYETMS